MTFDPSRQTFGFIKDNYPAYPGKIGVAIVQKDSDDPVAECIDFRICADRHEANAYLALYGLDPRPVWTAS